MYNFKKKLVSITSAASLVVGMFNIPGTSVVSYAEEAKKPIVLSKSAGWTFGIYMCGQNLEEEMGCSTNDLIEILKADVPKGFAKAKISVIDDDYELTGREIKPEIKFEGTDVIFEEGKDYEVKYALDKKFTKGKVRKNVSNKKSSLKISKLKKKKTYYVKVRAYILDGNGKKVYGNWSSLKKVRIKR